MPIEAKYQATAQRWANLFGTVLENVSVSF